MAHAECLDAYAPDHRHDASSPRFGVWPAIESNPLPDFASYHISVWTIPVPARNLTNESGTTQGLIATEHARPERVWR